MSVEFILNNTQIRHPVTCNEDKLLRVSYPQLFALTELFITLMSIETVSTYMENVIDSNVNRSTCKPCSHFQPLAALYRAINWRLSKFTFNRTPSLCLLQTETVESWTGGRCSALIRVCSTGAQRFKSALTSCLCRWRTKHCRDWSAADQ